MKHVPSFLKQIKGEYLIILIGLVGIACIILVLTGPSVGNVFSNIYTNVIISTPRSSQAKISVSPIIQPTDTAATGVKAALNAPYRVGHLIIKNGEMNLRVSDTDRAVDQITTLAVSSGGYVISSRTWLNDNLKYATMTIGVPSDQFEPLQRQIHAIGAEILSDTSSGQDVSDEYVDLQARQTNLEATAARIREFLGQAHDAEQALLVNAKLSEVEAELEQIKGRMAYLKERAAYSTLTINLEPLRPTPSPQPTATPLPTATPIVWMPEKTFATATTALTGILHVLGDVAIWLIAFVAPLAVPVILIILGIGWLQRRQAGRPIRDKEQS